MDSILSTYTQVELEDNLDDSSEEINATFDSTMEPFDPRKIDINVEQRSLHSIIERLRHGEIDMNTDFQRHAELWKTDAMGRLIESILIRFPLPAFYFDATSDDKWLIVDGLQRLSSIRRFVIDKNLALRGLEFLKELNGKKFDDLSRQYQRRIDETQVTIYLIRPGTPTDVKYSVFRRINTGGLVLNSQEIRHAMARTREREFLNRLSKNADFIGSIGDVSKRMQDKELILRFISFYLHDYSKFNTGIKELLDSVMEELKEFSENKQREIETAFNRSLKASINIFGEQAFEKRTEEDIYRRVRKNSALFESLTVGLSRLPDEALEKLVKNKEYVQEQLRKAIGEDTKFFNAISMATQKMDNVRIRFSTVENILKECSL